MKRLIWPLLGFALILSTISMFFKMQEVNARNEWQASMLGRAELCFPSQHVKIWFVPSPVPTKQL